MRTRSIDRVGFIKDPRSSQCKLSSLNNTIRPHIGIFQALSRSCHPDFTINNNSLGGGRGLELVLELTPHNLDGVKVEYADGGGGATVI